MLNNTEAHINKSTFRKSISSVKQNEFCLVKRHFAKVERTYCIPISKAVTFLNISQAKQ